MHACLLLRPVWVADCGTVRDRELKMARATQGVSILHVSIKSPSFIIGLVVCGMFGPVLKYSPGEIY